MAKKNSKWNEFITEFKAFTKSISFLDWVVLFYFVFFTVYAGFVAPAIIPLWMSVMTICYFTQMYLTYLYRESSMLYRRLYDTSVGLDKLYKDL